MLLERCRRCGNMPEVLYRVGYTYGTMKEARAHGAEVISAVHLETGHLMEILPDDIAVPLQILEVTLS